METVNENLVAPCGINCALCSNYLAWKNGYPETRGGHRHCHGCRVSRIKARKCAMKKRCKLLGEEKVEFCFECPKYPCQEIERLDKRYRGKYRASNIENLSIIKEEGLDRFAEIEREKHSCAGCGQMLSMHSGKCYKCDQPKSWRG